MRVWQRMLRISIDSIKLPESILRSVKELAKDNDIDRYSSKGANSYLFFGTSNILRRRIAIKYYYWGDEKQYHAEPGYLAAIENNNVLKIHYANSVDDEWAYFITDYCKNGDLDDLRAKKQIAVKESFNSIYDILSGLSALHSKKMVHRDLKPQNILIDDMNKPVIGDFGSVKRIPDGTEFIPGSGHAILYKPPEAFVSAMYSYCSDIYQVGIVLYQLLGGYLPYDDVEYLSERQKKEYYSISDICDRNIFVDKVLGEIIVKSKLLKIESLPCWITKRTRSIINKATHNDFKKRYSTCTEMMVEISKAKSESPNWRCEDECFVLEAPTMYRICFDPDDEEYYVQKRKHSDWRMDYAFDKTANYSKLVSEIEKR